MSASMIPPEFLPVLRQIDTAMREEGITWALTGSTGLAIKGIPVTPHDIDIQTDREGVQAFARRFAHAMVEAPYWRESEHTRSWFASFLIDGIQVEVMGDVQHKDEDGYWDDPANLAANTITIQVADMHIPTPTLDFEEEAYRSMGRHGKANLIAQYLRVC